jgi:hypothetical protein
MQRLFRVSCLVYIGAIFFLADSSAASSLAQFNPYSLLHIPLYGLLSLLVFLSIIPWSIIRFPWQEEMLRGDPQKEANHRLQRSHTPWEKYFLLAGGIAMLVAIADEYNQSFIPSRNASVGDVFLDLVGILLIFFVLSFLVKSK